MQTRPEINSSSLSTLLEKAASRSELAHALTTFLKDQRWFAAKIDGIRSVDVLDSVLIPGGRTVFELVLAIITTNSGATDCYALPMTVRPECSADNAAGNSPAASGPVIASLSGENESGTHSQSLIECSDLPEFWQAIMTALAEAPLQTRNGRHLKLSRTANTELGNAETLREAVFSVHEGEQTNSAVAIGDDFFVKLFRRPRVGHNPDAEVGIFLTDRTSFTNSPRVDATIDIIGPDGQRCLALISEQVSAQTDAWTYTLDNLKGYWARVAECEDRPESPPTFDLLNRDSVETFPPGIEQLSATLVGTFADDVASLGRRTAELHAALSSDNDDPAFAPEPLTQDSLNELVHQIRAEVQSTCDLLEQADPIEDCMANLPQKISLRANELLDEMSSFDPAQAHVVSIRCHGDYHLGQVLRTDSDFVILDFEGEPDRPFDERRQKRCAMKDVAGMIRSLHYASCSATVGLMPSPVATIVNPNEWQKFWYEIVRSAFLVGYELKAAGQPFFPADRAAFQQLLDLFLIEKVLYELRYEINNRPGWVKIPLAGLNAVLGLEN
ncbi:MAG: hypothetical protein O3B86_18020 [Planctomycetota bacterium]|nr:hypothetical protein [Planctomycetota bacterium]